MDSTSFMNRSTYIVYNQYLHWNVFSRKIHFSTTQPNNSSADMPAYSTLA